MCIEEDQEFTHVRPFEDQNANYSFWEDPVTRGAKIPLFELLTEAPSSGVGISLGDFDAQAGTLFPNASATLRLADMVCVFYMEAYIEEPDDCADGNCDNIA